MFIIEINFADKGVHYIKIKDNCVGCDLENYEVGDSVWFNNKGKMYQGEIFFYSDDPQVVEQKFEEITNNESASTPPSKPTTRSSTANAAALSAKKSSTPSSVAKPPYKRIRQNSKNSIDEEQEEQDTHIPPDNADEEGYGTGDGSGDVSDLERQNQNNQDDDESENDGAGIIQRFRFMETINNLDDDSQLYGEHYPNCAMIQLGDSGIWCRRQSLRYAMGAASATGVVRRLISGIFTPEAIKKSTRAGQSPKNKPREGSNPDLLHQKALSVIKAFAKEVEIGERWTKQSDATIRGAMTGKISELKLLIKKSEAAGVSYNYQ